MSETEGAARPAFTAPASACCNIVHNHVINTARHTFAGITVLDDTLGDRRQSALQRAAGQLRGAPAPRAQLCNSATPSASSTVAFRERL